MSGEAKSNQKDIELGCLHEGGKQGQGITIKKMKSNGSQKRREQTNAWGVKGTTYVVTG